MIKSRTLRNTIVATSCVALTVPLAGCDWLQSQTRETEMRNVEILPGTASDEMITLDQASGEGTAIDTVVTPLPAAPSTAEPVVDEAAAGEADAEPTSEGDIVIRPPAGGAEPVK